MNKIIRLKKLPVVLSIFMCLNSFFVYAEKTNSVPKFVSDFAVDANSGINLQLGKQYFTGFESLDEYKGFYIVPQNYMNSSTHTLSNEQAISGNAHKAYIYAANEYSDVKNNSHREYPAFKLENLPTGVISTAALIEFYVWVDIPLRKGKGEDWYSLATFSSYADDNWYRAYVFNVNPEHIVYLQHVPQNQQSIHDIFQTDSVTIPSKQWVKFTVYIDHQKNNKFNSPFIAVWQDSVLVSAARLDDRLDMNYVRSAPVKPRCLDDLQTDSTIDQVEQMCGLSYRHGLAQAHFGLYAAPLLSEGIIYNDDLTISEIIKTKLSQ